jgi:hypothetical protein
MMLPARGLQLFYALMISTAPTTVTFIFLVDDDIVSQFQTNLKAWQSVGCQPSPTNTKYNQQNTNEYQA